MKVLERKRAIELRSKGESIKNIAKQLSVSKGSVSVWVRKVSISSETRKSLFMRGWTSGAIEKRRSARLHNEEQKRKVIIDKAAQDIRKISKDDLKLIGIALYWAEGGKTQRLVRFSNSDPLIIKIIMRFFREICNVPENKFKAQIHIFSHMQAKSAEEYWSSISGISRDNFYKTYSKPSKASLGKRDSLPYGTLDITICDTRLFLTIFGWMQKVGRLITEI